MSTSLTLEISSDVPLAPTLADALSRLVAFVGESAAEAVSGAWQVALLITDDNRITDLHERFFDDASATDVITFPGTDGALGEGGHLGDIVISSETARANAEEAGHSTEREIAFLLLHGLLHLFGYHDDDPLEREQMLSRQEELLGHFESAEPDAWS